MVETETIAIMGGLMSPLYGMGLFFIKKVIDCDKCVQKIKTFLKMKYADDPQVEALK